MSWLHNYSNFGEKAFDDKPKNKKYFKKLKFQVINDYINDVGSLQDIEKNMEFIVNQHLLAGF